MKQLVVKVDHAFELTSKKEAEVLRASLELRAKHLKAELEKPLAAGVAAVLKDELRITLDMEAQFKNIRCCW